MWNLNKDRKWLMATIGLVVAWSGCVSEQELSATQPMPGEVEIDLTINIRSADNPMSRTDYELEKTPEECKITSVSIFIVPLTAGVEDWSNAQYRMVFNPVIVAGFYNLSFKITSPEGKKHLYAAANMSHAQTLAFMTSGEYRSTALTYKAVIDEFADPTATGKGIVMIAQMTTGTPESKVFDFSGTGIRTLATNLVELQRVVSKVLLVCKTNNAILGAEPGKNYGIAIGKPAWSPWIRLEEVYFALNPTGSVLFRNEDTALDQFVTIATPAPTTTPTAPEWMQTLEYDANRIGDPSSAVHYVDGLYCLANKVSVAGVDKSTKLAVRVKYAPNTLVVEYSTQTTTEVFVAESEVWNALVAPAGQTDENGDPASYPNGTYWRLDNTFYTYAGMMATIAGSPIEKGIKRGDFLPYLAGVGYYVVEIDASKDVLRNYYYILTVTEFGIPRHTLEITDGGEMQINSLKIDWLPKGVQSIIVKPE